MEANGADVVLTLEPSDFNFSKDVWSVIIQFIPTLLLAKFRCVNKMFQSLITIEQRNRAVTLDDHLSLGVITSFAFEKCIVSHVTYQEKDYYPFNTIWYNRPSDFPEQEHDPTFDCNGDDSDECETKNEDILIPAEDSDPIKYHFKARRNRCPYVCDEEPAQKVQMLIFEKSLVYLPHAVRLINTDGINSDHRGRNHANIQLDFSSEYTIPAGVHSVYDFVQGCFRIKGNKFENFYELVTMMSPDFDPNNLTKHDITELTTLITFDSNKPEWIVTPNIDHGS